MRRLIVMTLALMMLLAPLRAFAASFDTDRIEDVKQALVLMSYGEYKKALKRLNFKGNVSASDLADFVKENMSDLGSVSVQTDVAVAYSTDGNWFVAVPVEEPLYDSVNTFVLRAKNGGRFDACRALAWYEVLDMVNEADSVIWQNAYEESSLYAIPDA